MIPWEYVLILVALAYLTGLRQGHSQEARHWVTMLLRWEQARQETTAHWAIVPNDTRNN